MGGRILREEGERAGSGEGGGAGWNVAGVVRRTFLFQPAQLSAVIHALLMTDCGSVLALASRTHARIPHPATLKAAGTPPRKD